MFFFIFHMGWILIVHNVYSCMNRISARGEARRNLTNSTSISTLNSETYIQGAILNFSRTGEFPNKIFINSISWGTPLISVIFTIFKRLNLQSEGHSVSQKSKFDTSWATFAFDEPYTEKTIHIWFNTRLSMSENITFGRRAKLVFNFIITYWNMKLL